MKKFKFMKLFSILISVCFIFSGCSQGVESKDLDLKIVFTNDIHGRIAGDENAETGKNIGLSKIASYISGVKEDNKSTLIIDAGDVFHGDTIANLSQGQAVLNIMNVIGFNCFVPGNHEFNFGKERLIELTKNGRFKTICSNLLSNGAPLFEENDIFEINDVKIGVFGLTSPELITKNDPKKVEGIEVLDPIESAENQVQILKGKGADLIILIAHLGIQTPNKDWQSYAVRDNVPGIDLIIDAHSHDNLGTIKQREDKALITSAGNYGQELGIVDIKIKDNVKEINPYNLSFSYFKDVKKSAKIEEIIKFETEKMKAILQKKIGYTHIRLNGDRETVRRQETNLTKMACDAVLKETGADVVFLNAAGFRSSIEVGNITMEDVLRVFSLNHYVITKQVNGENIIKALERAIKQYPGISAIYPQVAGITFEIVTSENSNTVKNVYINGENIDLNRNYVVATNNFLCVGGDGFDMLKNNVSPYLKRYSPLDEIFAKYISEISPIREESNYQKVA